ncbi:MAG: PIN domain-containing protein [Methanocaldococcus sp.]
MEKTLYDTNKLIDAYKNNEKLNGYVTIFSVIEFPKALKLGLKIVYPSKEDYSLAIKLSNKLLKIGKPIPAIDILISAIAINRKMKLITKDKHFSNVKEIFEDFDIVIEG